MPIRIASALLLVCWAAAAQSVAITWIGQACFILRGSGTVVTDPPVASIGYRLPPMTADAVTVTHNHPDHNNTAAVSGDPVIVDGRPVTARQEMTVNGIPFVLIPGFHDNTNGSQRGQNTIVRWTQAGLKFAHFGDFGQDQLTEMQRADLAGLDLLRSPPSGISRTP